MTKFTASLVALLALVSVGRAQTATVTTLQVPSQPVAQGVPVLVKASVTQNGTPVTTGTVTFCPVGTYTPGPFPCGQLAYGSAQLTQSGTASTYIGLPPGTTQLVALYRGTKALAGSVSVTQTATVAGGISTATSLQVSGSASSGWDFLADVSGTSTSTELGGSVSFLDSSDLVLETIDLNTPPTTEVEVGDNSGVLSDATCGEDNFQLKFYPVLGDFNGDGYLDAAYACPADSGIAIQLGEANGIFKPGPHSNYTKSVTRLAVGDFNSDGVLDLVTDSGDLLLGNGDGTFSAPSQTLSLPSGTTGFLVADFDGDGTLDLGVISSKGFYIYFNSVSGFSATPVVTAAETETVAVVADFNQDGIVDLAEVESSGSSVDVLLGNGDGTFIQKAPVSINSYGGGIGTADMNLDGKPDLIVSGTPTFLIGNGDGTFSSSTDTNLPNGNDYSGAVIPMGENGVAIVQPYGGTGVLLQADPSNNFIASSFVDEAVEGASNNEDEDVSSAQVLAGDILRSGISSPFWFYSVVCADQSCGGDYFVGADVLPMTYTLSLAFDSGSLTFPQTTTVHATYAGSPFASSTSNAITVAGQNVPIITWPTPNPIAYGDALSGSQLDASANVAGTFAYNPGVGTLLSIGTHTLSTTFTPTNTNDTTATASVTLTVTKATPTITWPTPVPIVFGTTLSGTQLDATAGVAGTFVYNPGSGSLLSAGTHTLSVTFTPTDTTDYTTANASVTLTVTAASKTTPTITWTPPAFIHYGTLLTVSQLNATASVPGSFSYTPTFGTQLSVGSHTITANFTPTDTTDYNTATKSATLAVYAATPVLTWPTPAAITYGTNLSGMQLDATAATTQGASLAGSFTYSPTSGTSLAAGSHTLTVTFTPSDTVDYVAVSKSVTLTVNKAAPTLTWATPASIKSGTALSATQLDAKSTVAGTFTYSPAAGTVLAVGTHTLLATFTPSNATDYAGGTATVTLTVTGTSKANPVITWATPAPITYGTKLSGTQLNATASVAGSFTYSPVSGTELGAGSHSITATFTPTNTTTYNTVTKSVTLTVNKANPVLTWATPASITDGTKLSATQLDCKSNITGTFVYSPAAGTVLAKGTHTLSVTFTPASGNATNYNTGTKTVSLTVK